MGWYCSAQAVAPDYNLAGFSKLGSYPCERGSRIGNHSVLCQKNCTGVAEPSVVDRENIVAQGQENFVKRNSVWLTPIASVAM